MPGLPDCQRQSMGRQHRLCCGFLESASANSRTGNLWRCAKPSQKNLAGCKAAHMRARKQRSDPRHALRIAIS